MLSADEPVTLLLNMKEMREGMQLSIDGQAISRMRNGERLTVKVSAVQHGGAVVPVDLSVYDTNGNEGIPVPGSEELNAVKEIAANMGAGMGSSITITDDAGSQLLSDLGRSAIQGVSQYVSKKMRSVKVTLKAGYSVLLLPPLQ